ncbi:ABC transporter substrate-binding protein [Actinacidiphila bryophytorum]|uniref:Raffinose/stachyose/melibiose transport system substrate-binding protein n=1 Tax=Actinacidiphila bryophytorum TaxID=1436133 RepID=A0A9W4MBI3_9ACTN|nr:extracellular solute-binding protein [Actinacidiphila bryophytorum]MBM9437081.1 extracellular solute-binding protein [Actinacidiphila bryophytorum]MBN6544177.1 extracellular solute-binding protein [Actinacidiphila bryophytorum]CAG7646550.1 Raffinose/stachyose/melibiose transport system substrate-binding protein [Actinacidiphila bryophytorum]
MAKLRKPTAVTAMALAGALLLASCGSSGGGAGDGRTLRLWHYEAPNSAMGIAWNQAVAEFKKSHPGVKVEFEAKGFEQIQKTASMVLNSDGAPDVMEYNKGNATAGLLARQGLLTDLTPEVTKYGWDKLLSPSVSTTSRYSAQGIMGSGNWYGVPNYGEYAMVYYNKDLFASNGVKVPTTPEEFTAALAAFKAKGITPLADSGAEYPAQQYLYQLALSKADRAWVDAFELYKGKADFHDAAWTYAADTFADWVSKGYIAKTSSGAKAEDAGVSFISGRSPMFFSGSWWFGRFKDENKFAWGTFLWPGSKLTPGSGGNLWVVPKNAKNKQLAYDFIDITMKKGVQNALGNNGGIPVAADPSAITDPQSKALIGDFTTVSGADGLAFYPDWPVPGFYDVLVSAVQKLITGSAKPDDVLDQLQKAYDAGIPR